MTISCHLKVRTKMRAIRGYNSGVTEDPFLLGCDAVQLRTQLTPKVSHRHHVCTSCHINSISCVTRKYVYGFRTKITDNLSHGSHIVLLHHKNRSCVTYPICNKHSKIQQQTQIDSVETQLYSTDKSSYMFRLILVINPLHAQNLVL